MPIPETPYTREEAYLNAIATGDSGGIPETPYTREEMYLDYIARNGSGGGGGGGGSSTLSGLTDVDISNPTDGQTLVYNASAGKWENGAGGGGVMVVNRVAEVEMPLRLDLSWQAIHDLFTSGVILVSPLSVLIPGSQDLYENYQLFVTEVVNDEGPMYYVTLRDAPNNIQEYYACENANDYPVAMS